MFLHVVLAFYFLDKIRFFLSIFFLWIIKNENKWSEAHSALTARCVHSFDRTDKIIVVLHYNFIDTTVINWLWRRLLPFSPILLGQFYVHWELLIITSPFFIAYGHFAHNGIHCNIARPTWLNTIRRKGGKRERSYTSDASVGALVIIIYQEFVTVPSLFIPSTTSLWPQEETRTLPVS